jgi:RNA polymerase sigma-70 factor (ECF subfamily)
MRDAIAATTADDPRVRRMDARAVLSQRRRRRSSRSDPQLVERAQAGDERAFAELVDRYGGAVVSLCYASTMNVAEAEDLSQEVFMAAWRGLPRFRGASAFSTWLFALARNACIDQARRRAVRPQLVDDREPAADVVDEAPRETARAILAAAAELSLPLRQALLLRDVQGLSYEEIARVQDVPLGTVRSRLSAARAAVVERVSG